MKNGLMKNLANFPFNKYFMIIVGLFLGNYNFLQV